MSRRKLPLESPHWWPIIEALEHRSQQTGSDKLATLDFNQALKAGRLRGQIRRADGHRELLAVSAWEDLYVQTWVRLSSLRITPGRPPGLPRVEMSVFSHKLEQRPAGCWFYVWLPDYKNIFGPVTTPAEPPAQSQEVPIKRGKKPVHDRAELQSVALGLALLRKQGAPEKKRADVVDELREWCTRNKRKVPADSTLYDIVAAAFRIKPTLKS